MIGVEIIESNLAFFDEYELSDQISYSEFLELSQNMETGEYVKFELYEDGSSFYRGNFEKKADNRTVTDDIFSVLKSYQKQKKLKRKQQKDIQLKLKQALLVEKKDATELTPKTQTNLRSIKHQKSESHFTHKLLICFVSVIVLVGLSFTGYSLLEKEEAGSTYGQKNYSQLLNQKQYLSAAEAFPDKREEIKMVILEEIIQSKGETERLEQYLDIMEGLDKGAE